MALTFDTRAYARFLQDRGVTPKDAETHAEAAQLFIIDPLSRTAQAAAELYDSEGATKHDLQESEDRLNAKIDAAVEKLGLQMQLSAKQTIIVLGSVMAAGIGILGVLIGVFAFLK